MINFKLVYVPQEACATSLACADGSYSQYDCYDQETSCRKEVPCPTVHFKQVKA